MKSLPSASLGSLGPSHPTTQVLVSPTAVQILFQQANWALAEIVFFILLRQVS
jgi:hypothetical protein